MRLLLGHDDAVAQWVGWKIGVPLSQPYTAIGWIDDPGHLQVGFVFHNYVPGGNIEIAVAASGMLTRSILATVGNYAFNQAGARRIMARTPASNKKACDILQRIGFVKESVCRHFYPDDDAAQYRLLKKDAERWL